MSVDELYPSGTLPHEEGNQGSTTNSDCAMKWKKCVQGKIQGNRVFCLFLCMFSEIQENRNSHKKTKPATEIIVRRTGEEGKYGTRGRRRISQQYYVPKGHVYLIFDVLPRYFLLHVMQQTRQFWLQRVNNSLGSHHRGLWIYLGRGSCSRNFSTSSLRYVTQIDHILRPTNFLIVYPKGKTMSLQST